MLRSGGLARIWIVLHREYTSRVKTKGFWIGTLLLPIFMAAMTVVPSLLLLKSQGELHLALVDDSGKIAGPFVERVERRAQRVDDKAPSPAQGQVADPVAEAAAQAKDEKSSVPLVSVDGVRPGRPMASKITIRVDPPAAEATTQNKELDRQVLGEEIDAWIRIPADVLTSSRVEYHGESVSNFITQELLEKTMSRVVREVRLRDAGLDVDRIESLSKAIDIETTRVTAEGGRQESGIAGFMVAYLLFFLLFLTIMIWGQQVLTGVLEEKSSRIVEVIVSAVRPFELLMGKLLGIAAVGLTQVGIWLGFMVLITAPAVIAAVPFMAGAGMKIPSIPLSLMFHFLAFFLLGFLLYASYFAAIGSAFNNLQEAQQTAGFLNFILVAPLFCFMAIINDPDSTLSVGLSLFPLFTPLLMLLRIAVKMPPLWQVVLGYAISIGAVIGMVWICGKVYRVGILMYGKKPTLPEIWKWLRYS